MSKKSLTYICQNCSYKSVKWLGKCPDCGQWNSFTEEEDLAIKAVKHHLDAGLRKDSGPRSLTQIKDDEFTRIVIGINEIDRVLGGGITVGSIILIGGEPGIGKSTLLMEVCGKLVNVLPSEKILYVSGEESEGQVASRSRRLGVIGENFLIYNETSWQKIVEQLKKIKPKILVLDSIQTTVSNLLDSTPGTISQIREVTYELMNYAKAMGITCFVIGHVTKEGNIAGPKILEHMVDTVVYFEGDQFGHYRLLRSIKNRFGNTNEVGIFEMKESGLVEVSNPSVYFLEENIKGSFGRSITCISEGSRALFVEIQALVIENKYGNGRRTTQGLDSNRLAMLVAVIEKYFSLPLGYNDIYVNVVGGIKLQSRESDLSIIASILSSNSNKALDDKTIFIGEVGLTGEVRSVPFLEMRLKEIALLNYKKVITSARTAKEYKEKFPIEIIGIKMATEINDYL